MTVLKEIPSWATVLEVLQLLHLSSDFGKEFTKSELENPSALDAIVIVLYPYYYESKAKEYLDCMTSKKCITVLRHILLPHGYVILGKDTTTKGKHKTFYKIIPTEKATNLPAAVTVGFN